MGFDENLFQEIANRLLEVAPVLRIILFGSAPAETMNRDSDIDVLVVSDSPVNTIEHCGRLHESLRRLGFPFDVFQIATDSFETTKHIFGGTAYPAHKYGRITYDAA